MRPRIRRGERRKVSKAYEWFLKLPKPIVLSILWIAGAMLISLTVLVLYLVWLLLRVALEGLL